MNYKFWTDKEIEVLRESYANTPTRVLAKRFGRTEKSIFYKAVRMGLRKSNEYLKTEVACRLSGKKGVAYRFKTGNTPHNKGKKGWQAGGRAKETQFKKGVLSGNAAIRYQPIGTERIVKGGYLQRKMSDKMPAKNCWKMVHTLEWEKRNGPTPKGYIVIFRNGDKRDFRYENLELISLAENMRRNTIHRYPFEMKQTIRLVGKLRRMINEKQD